MPIRDWQIIVGKLLAATVLLWPPALTFVYAITFSILGDLDFGPLPAATSASLLFGPSCVPIGLLASSFLTRNQIVAFILGFAIIFVCCTAG
ncbi:MAG: hypothetical protein R2834_04200 [Rhodothermales bacterium]